MSSGLPVPSVSVIVPNLNGGEMLLECLRSVFSETSPPLEVILVDNGSDDGSAELAAKEFPALQLVRNDTNVGYAEACNQGAGLASSDLLLFLNTDVVLAAGCLVELVDTAHVTHCGVLQPLILYPDGSVDSAGDLFTWSGFFWHQNEVSENDGVTPIFAAKGACMLVRGDLFSSLEGFNESYFAYFEEADLCWRARMMASEVVICPRAVAIHRGGSTTRRIFAPSEIYHLSFRNRIRTLLANPSRASMWRICPLHLLGCLVTAAAFALRGRLAVALAILKALAWPVLNLDAIKGQRVAAQRTRSVSDVDVFEPSLVFSLSLRFSARLLLNTLTRWQNSAGQS